MFKSITALAAVVLCVAPLSVSAQQSRDVSRENQELRSRLNRLESLVEQFRASDPSPQTAVDGIPPISDERPVEHASFSTWQLNNALSDESPAFPIVRVSGFFQADAGWVSQSGLNRTAVGDVQDGADFRRARLSAEGHVADNVAYMLEMDFAFPGRPTFMDVWGEVRDLEGLQNVRVGQYRNPFGLDGLTSVKELTFLERALPFAFLPFRQIGVMTHGVSDDEEMTWAVSGFRALTDQFGGNAGDGGYGMAARITGVLLDFGDDEILHIGGAYSVIDPAENTVQYRNQPEFFVSSTGRGATPFFVDTMPISTDIVNLFAGELAATSGSWHAQAEVIYAVVNRSAGSSVTFSGASAQMGCILTGEHRPYNRSNGVLGRIVPYGNFGSNGACGAWEVAARWSYLDLNDGGVNGGQLHDLTAGLNWYLNGHTKLQLNYVHAFLNSAGFGDSDADIVAMRAQVDF